MALHPGQRAEDIPIEYILSVPAQMVDSLTCKKPQLFWKEKNQDGVTGIVVPGSRPVRKAAENWG